MKINFYLSFLVLFFALWYPADAQSSLKWEKQFRFSGSGASTIMLTDDSLNSYFIGVKEDSSFFYKLDSIGNIIIKQPFSKPFEFTTSAKKLPGNPDQFVFFGGGWTSVSYYKYDLKGNKLAETLLNNVNEITGYDIDASGNVYLVSSGVNTFYITKVNSGGGIAWQKVYDDPNTDNEMDASIKCGINNDLYFVYEGGSAKDQSIVHPIVSYSSVDGTLRWKSFVHNRLAPESTLDKPVIAIDASGNIICAAAIYDTLSSNEKAIVCKLGSVNGNILFKVEDTSAFMMNSHSQIVLTADNKIIISGNISFSFGSITKCYSSSGIFQWVRNFQDRTLLGDRQNFIYSPQSNRLYYALGKLFNTTDTVAIYSQNTSNVFEKLIPYTHQSLLTPRFTNTSLLIGAVNIVKGNIFILGNAAETAGAFGFAPSEPFILRYSSAAAGINKSAGTAQFQLYPNPSKDELIIRTAKPIGKSSQYFILASTGAVISTGSLDDNQGSINISSLPSGIYFINIDGGYARFIKE
jgi:hypothetical protein